MELTERISRWTELNECTNQRMITREKQKLQFLFISEIVRHREMTGP